MLEAKTMMATLATETTSADNDVRSANNGDNAGYCDNHSTITAMQRTMLEAANNDNNTGYCDILSTLTAMQRTMLEATPTMTTLATTDNNADNDVRSTNNDDTPQQCRQRC